jgi:NAD(P) transhydrogenase
LKSGKSVLAEVALSAVGRTGATANLGLDKAGVTVDDRGRIPVNEYFQTNQPHIYAVGDVVGFPALASTAMEQGRHAVRHAFGLANGAPSLQLFPYGIYTVPEISMVGRTEDELTDASVPYEVGKARFRELARGQITGDTIGLLKLLFDPDTRRLLGVHVIGEGASEIVHIGQALMAHGGTVDWLSDAVFNYPTMAEAYKVAALDGLNRLSGR